MFDRQAAKAAPRIPGVRAIRISIEIRPIGVRRILQVSATPSDRLATGCDYDSHAFGQRMMRIGIDKIEIALKRVAIERLVIAVLGIEIADRLGASCHHLPARHRWRRRVVRPLEEHEWRVQPGDIPRDIGAGADVVDALTHPVEHLGRRQATLTDHLGQ